MPETRCALREPTSLSIPVPDVHAILWTLATALFVVGDLTTTAVGLELGLVETHPIGQSVIASAGPLGLLVPKLVAVGLCGALYVVVGRWRPRWAVGIPLGLAALGATLTAYNWLLLSSSLH